MNSSIEDLLEALAKVSHERDLLLDAVNELESGLRIIALAGKGSGLGSLKLVAKQSLNRAFSTKVKS